MTTDRDIIRRSHGEPAAFAALFDRHARVVGAYAAQRVGRDAAPDVLSETFLVAFRRRASFDTERESALPWLLGIATRLVARHRSAEARQWRSVVAAGSLAEHADEFAASEDRADALAAITRLAPRIRALSAGDRDALLLHAWADLTYEQIADALGIPIGTVRSRLHRVRRVLGERAPALTPAEGAE